MILKPTRIAKSRTGMTLVEVAVSSLLVGILLVTSLRSTLLIHSSNSQIDRQTLWYMAADSLIEELRGLHYSEPDGESPLGCDNGESISDRTTWDDCDDAAGYKTAKLKNRDGSLWGEIPLTATIDVKFVSPFDMSTSNVDMGLKKAVVRVGEGRSESISVEALFTSPPVAETHAHRSIQATLKFGDKTKLTFTAAPRNRVEAL